MSDGSVPHAVTCERCEQEFSLTMMAIGEPFEDLGDPFLAKCPECGHSGSYAKNAVRTHGKEH